MYCVILIVFVAQIIFEPSRSLWSTKKFFFFLTIAKKLYNTFFICIYKYIKFYSRIILLIKYEKVSFFLFSFLFFSFLFFFYRKWFFLDGQDGQEGERKKKKLYIFPHTLIQNKQNSRTYVLCMKKKMTNPNKNKTPHFP